MPISKSSKKPEKVVADSNVLLSAVIGKAAAKVFSKTKIAVAVTVFNLEEVKEYLPMMATKYKLDQKIVETQLALLPLQIYSEADYQEFLNEAQEKMDWRDPEDIDALALALKLKVPVWSNDNDFKTAGIEFYTTAQLLKVLGV